MERSKKSILIINTIGMGFEGISSVIVNYVRAMNKDDIEIDFIGYPTTKKVFMDILAPLGKLHIIPEKKKDLMGYIMGIVDVTQKGYDVVHIHGNSGTMLIEALISKKNRAKKIFVHCHNTTCNHPLINHLLTPIMKKTATYLLSCSVESGKWLYGNSKYFVLNNAISLEKFSFNEVVRQQCRKELGIDKEYVIGHIGSFIEQKNHLFLIDIFNELQKKIPYSKLLLASDGVYFDKVKKKVYDLGLESKVLFVGRRGDVERMYQAMDIFVMPSKWEGLPVVMVEAQASGLPVLVSDCVTKEAKCTEKTYFKSLDDGAYSWSQKICDIKNMDFNRKESVTRQMREKGFDIVIEAGKLKEIYMS